jgi:hypothetical protein
VNFSSTSLAAARRLVGASSAVHIGGALRAVASPTIAQHRRDMATKTKTKIKPYSSYKRRFATTLNPKP